MDPNTVGHRRTPPKATSSPGSADFGVLAPDYPTRRISSRLDGTGIEASFAWGRMLSSVFCTRTEGLAAMRDCVINSMFDEHGLATKMMQGHI